jgi:hypothetical protein
MDLFYWYGRTEFTHAETILLSTLEEFQFTKHYLEQFYNLFFLVELA